MHMHIAYGETQTVITRDGGRPAYSSSHCGRRIADFRSAIRSSGSAVLDDEDPGRGTVPAAAAADADGAPMAGSERPVKAETRSDEG